MTISMILACNRNGAIGYKNQLLWRIPEDLRNFKTLTLGNTVVMGRKTFESIGHPLSGRRNVVVSRNPNLVIPGVEVVGSMDEALTFGETIYIIGGSQIYNDAINRGLVDEIWMTLIDDFNADADAFVDREKIDSLGFKKEITRRIERTEDHPEALVIRYFKED